MSKVRKSDVMCLEAYLRRISKGMNPKLICHNGGLTNQPLENPVQVTWGSNSFHVGRDDLEPLIDYMEDEDATPNGFLRDVWIPFLQRYADN